MVLLSSLARTLHLKGQSTWTWSSYLFTSWISMSLGRAEMNFPQFRSFWRNGSRAVSSSLISSQLRFFPVRLQATTNFKLRCSPLCKQPLSIESFSPQSCLKNNSTEMLIVLNPPFWALNIKISIKLWLVTNCMTSGHICLHIPCPPTRKSINQPLLTLTSTYNVCHNQLFVELKIEKDNGTCGNGKSMWWYSNMYKIKMSYFTGVKSAQNTAMGIKSFSFDGKFDKDRWAWAGLSLRAVTRNTCHSWAYSTVMGVDVYWCCIGATLNLHAYCTATGDNYNVMADKKLNDSTAWVSTDNGPNDGWE